MDIIAIIVFWAVVGFVLYELDEWIESLTELNLQHARQLSIQCDHEEEFHDTALAYQVEQARQLKLANDEVELKNSQGGRCVKTDPNDVAARAILDEPEMCISNHPKCMHQVNRDGT